MIAKPVVIITGVSGGIGLATARLFIEYDWVVVGTVRDKKLPAEVTALAIDLQVAEMTQPTDLSRVVKDAHKTYGRIDAVVANAGYALLGALEELSYDQIVTQLSVNVAAAAELTRLSIPIMRQQKRGAVIAISSLAGILGLPSYGAYSASKFALEGLFESLWYELADTGIKVRLVEPSSVKTSFWTTGLVRSETTRPVRYVHRFMTRSVASSKAGGLAPEDVAKVVFEAATSTSDRLHWRKGFTWLAVLGRRVLPDVTFRRLIRWYAKR